jgi:hypothetical protein
MAEITLPAEAQPEHRARMIEEAAYYRFLQRGLVDGNDVNDWLAAEAEIDGSSRHADRPAQDDVGLPRFCRGASADTALGYRALRNGLIELPGRVHAEVWR